MPNDTPVLTIQVYKGRNGFRYKIAGEWEGVEPWRNTGLPTNKTAVKAAKAALSHVEYVGGIRPGPKPRGYHVARLLV